MYAEAQDLDNCESICWKHFKTKQNQKIKMYFFQNRKLSVTIVTKISFVTNLFKVK